MFYVGPSKHKSPLGVEPELPTPSNETPVILISLVKRRKPEQPDTQAKVKASMLDEAVWDLRDEDIIGTLHTPHFEHAPDHSCSCFCQNLEVTGLWSLSCFHQAD